MYWSRYVCTLWTHRCGDDAPVRWQLLLWLRFPPKVKRTWTVIFTGWIIGPFEFRRFR